MVLVRKDNTSYNKNICSITQNHLLVHNKRDNTNKEILKYQP